MIEDLQLANPAIGLMFVIPGVDELTVADIEARIETDARENLY